MDGFSSAPVCVIRSLFFKDICKRAFQAIHDLLKFAEGDALLPAPQLVKCGRRQSELLQIKLATTLDSNHWAAWQYRGELEKKHQDFQGVLESFTRALSINKTAEFSKRRAKCYRQLSLAKEAEEDRRELEKLTAVT